MIIYEEHQSVTRRYSSRLSGISSKAIYSASQREWAAIKSAGEYHGVSIDILDMSSETTTGTFKDWVACVALAHTLQNAIPAFITQTSGNTGNALASYASYSSIRCIILYPSESRVRIQAKLATSPLVEFVEVAASEEAIKRFAAQASESLHIPYLPIFDQQIEGNKLRAYFLDDATRTLKKVWNWHVQALSSAFGIFGLYRGFDEIRMEGQEPLIPRFLGVQQEAIAPYAEFINDLEPRTGVALLEPTLFRRQLPVSFLNEMRSIVDRTSGMVTRLENATYESLEGDALALFESAGIELIRDPTSGSLNERAGVIAMVGALQGILDGAIRPGENVIVALTGGAGGGVREGFTPRFFSSGGDVQRVINQAWSTVSSS
jgi:threonine synthase